MEQRIGRIKLVFKAPRRDYVQPLLQALHWLPVQARIDNRLSTICHNLFSNSLALPFLFDLVFLGGVAN